MSVIPAPELPALKVHKHPFLVRIGYAFVYAIAASVLMAMVGLWIINAGAVPALMPMLKVYVLLTFAMFFALMFAMDQSKPSVTLEEIWYRKRLDLARHRDNRVEQLNADYVLLEAAAESLYKKLGKDEFAKIKDANIIDHAIELARKKTVD